VKVWGVFILCLALAATAGVAQIIINGGIAGNPNQLIIPNPQVDKTNGVYVRDSAIAMEKLALARRMERAHEWNKSADVYQEILEKYPDRVVERTEEPQIQYASVTETVRQSLCKWPLEGLLVYRSRYETPASKLLTEGATHNLDKLHEALWRYFPTDAAKAAGVRLMDIYFEQGDYAAASDIGKELLNWHPNLVAERPMVLYRAAIAARLAGQNDDANHWLTELRNQFPQAMGSIRGQDVILADSLAKEISAAQIVHAEVNDSWLTVGGDESRGKGCSSTVKPGARLYSIPLMHFNWATILEPGQRQQMQRNDDDSRKKGAGLGIMPAVDNGQLFFQDNTRIYALDLDTGVPLPAWLDTNSADQGAYKLKTTGSPTPVPLGRQLCLSVSDKYVTAIMGLSDLLAPNVGPNALDSRLVCLDRTNGKELWTTTLEDLPESENALKVLQMCGSPLMVGDNVYVLVHGLKGQFEDCYVACFALATGQFRWATFIANASADPAIGIMADDTFQYSDAISHIAYASGRLFVVTNIGAVASLDAYTGAIAWLDIYRSESPPAGAPVNLGMINAMRAQDGLNGSLASVPWVYNSAIIQNGKLFILPNDSHSLFIYDAGSGALVKQIKLSDLQEQRDPAGASNPDLPTTLLAVRDDLVYLAGERQVWQVPWDSIGRFKKVDYTPRYWRSTDNGSEEDTGASGHSAEDQPIQIRGRAFVTADSVYLPTERCLRRILLSDGRLDPAGSVFPRTGWEDGREGPGNVVVTQDHVIVAGDQQVAVYTDVALAKAKLDRAIAEAPGDPDARLHYAEVMFAAGQPDAAESRLNEGFQLLGGTHSLRTGPSRDRAFNDSLSFAKRLSQKGGDAREIERFFDLAQAAASKPHEQVSYRLARGQYEWNKANRDPTASLALYEEILAEPTYRAVQLPDPVTNAPTQASALADKSIEVIKGTPDGKVAYDKFEQIALQKLQEAKLAANPDQLLDIAQVYPDSQVAGDAMLSAASLYESRGNPRMATQVLRRLLLRKHDLDRVPVLEALARNYLRIPGDIDVAVSRLNLAATLAPGANLSEPLTLPNGGAIQNVSLASALDLLARYESQLSLESLPDLHLPTHEQALAYRKAMGRWVKPFLPETPNMKISGVDAMIVPLEDFSRNDRIIAWSTGDGISVYSVGQNRPIFTTVAINQAPIGAAWLGPSLLVWSSSAVTLLDGGSGQQKWTREMSSLPTIVNQGDAAAQPDADQATGAEEVSQVRPAGDRIVVSTSNGRLLAIDTTSGSVAWQIRAGGAINPLLANSEFTVLRLQSGQTIELQAYNTFTGELIGRKSFGVDTGAVPLNFALAADGTLVYTLPNQLCIQDLFQATLSPSGMDPSMMVEAGPAPVNIFQGAGQPEPDQLLLHAGKIYAVANSGKEVRVYSIDTGDPFQFSDRSGRATIPAAFSTESTSANVRLHVSGNYLYVFSPRNLTAHRVDAPTGLWTNWDPTKTTNFQQILFGRDYIGVIDRPGPPPTESNRLGSKLTLNLFNRHGKDIAPDVEAGVLIFQPELQIEGESYALQPVEGGIAFFTGHGAIHFLMGARDSLGN
jgi:outer membrane protein assembly factor BamB